MRPERPFEPRVPFDRRARQTTGWDAFRRRGRRRRPRRDPERQGAYYVDLIDPPTFVLAVALLVLTVADGVLTLLLLGVGCEEINPAMGYLLDRGPTYFVIGKYLLTCAGLPFLLICRYFPLFRTNLRVGHLLPLFVGLYVILLGYQLALLNSPPPEPAEWECAEPF